MKEKKIIKSTEKYLEPRPGFNWLVGYHEGKPISSSGGLPEMSTTRPVKDGKDVSK